jgi:hypothetical protein
MQSQRCSFYRLPYILCDSEPWSRPIIPIRICRKTLILIVGLMIISAHDTSEPHKASRWTFRQGGRRRAATNWVSKAIRGPDTWNWIPCLSRWTAMKYFRLNAVTFNSTHVSARHFTDEEQTTVNFRRFHNLVLWRKETATPQQICLF